MFTGIIEETGIIKNIVKGANSVKLTLAVKIISNDLKTGDSVSVNGVCLTVTNLSENTFTADVMPETIRKTALAQLKAGDQVNLERAMKPDGRFGGHIVSGHIDGTGTISKIEKEDNAIWITIKADQEILRYMIDKGSIAIDGISLTIAGIEDNSFSVSIIPHTAAETTLAKKGVGQSVNLECDLIGKYIYKYFNPGKGIENKNELNLELLKKYGF